MASLTITLPDHLAEKARKVAEAAGITFDEWVARTVAMHVDNAWPPEFIAAGGCCPDLPDLEDLIPPYGTDAPRATLGDDE